VCIFPIPAFLICYSKLESICCNNRIDLFCNSSEYGIRFGKGAAEDDDIPETEYSDRLPGYVPKMIKNVKEEKLEDAPVIPGEIKELLFDNS
jgi:hypothetical protein